MNIFKLAIRHLFRDWKYSLLTLTGLVIGLSVSIIGFLYVINELSYDRFHKNEERIFRIAIDAKFNATEIKGMETSAPMAMALYNDIPEIEMVTRVKPFILEFEYKDEKYIEDKVFAVDSTFFEIFSFPVIKGKSRELLNEPNCAVLTRSTAEKYFGDKNPINQIIFNGENSFRIISVIEDIPDNSHFHFDIALSLVSFDGYYNSTNWGNNMFKTYIMISENTDYNSVEAKLPDFINKHLFDNNYGEFVDEDNKWEYYLQPLKSIHLNSDLSAEFEVNGRKEYVNIFLLVSILILVIASINTVNLTTARSIKRAKEVGLRKVLGCKIGNLRLQFILESILTSLIALVLALGMVEIILMFLHGIIGAKLHVPYENIYITFPALLGFGLLIGSLSGLYPAAVLSSFKPISTLKGGHQGWIRTHLLRNVLVIFQFLASTVLVISLLVISKQLSLLKNENLGFEKDRIMIINNSKFLGNSTRILKHELQKLPYVMAVAYSSHIPGMTPQNIGFQPEGQDEAYPFNLYHADESFADVFKLEISKGRFFSEEYSTDSLAIIINKDVEKIMGNEDILNKRLNYRNYPSSDLHIVGVLNTFQYESKLKEVQPFVLLNMKRSFRPANYLSLKMGIGNTKQMVDGIVDVWDRFASGLPIDYFFFDEYYDSLYKNENQMKKLIVLLALIAISLACLGLLGLVSHAALQKTKEIGIRKTFGASVNIIFISLLREFQMYGIIGNLIAWPIAFYVLNGWLNNFSEKTELSWWYFALSLLIILFLTFITVSYQSFRASKTNPIDELRYE